MNSTKLSAFCDRVIEVGWLVAVIVTPLFFNVYSSRIFDPDKITVLRTIALVMAAVWTVKLLEERASGNRDVGCTWRTPLVLPTLFMVVVYLVSTALSVTPWVSLFGSYSRLQGTFTTLFLRRRLPDDPARNAYPCPTGPAGHRHHCQQPTRRALRSDPAL